MTDAGERFVEGWRADPVDLGREAEAGPDAVEVRVDQSGNDGCPSQIDDAGPRAGEFPDIGRSADGGDCRALNRDGFPGGEVVVDGEDFAVDEDGVDLRPRRE